MATRHAHQASKKERNVGGLNVETLERWKSGYAKSCGLPVQVVRPNPAASNSIDSCTHSSRQHHHIFSAAVAQSSVAMAEEVAMGIAETIQTAHINPQPDPAYDVNPSTAASKKTPVHIRSHARESRRSSPHSSPAQLDDQSDEIPISMLDPHPRSTALPPLPDLRFEQSYLARIKPYSDAKNYKMVAFYTVWDHVVMPLTQGLVWRLAVFGWRSWNTGAQFQGRGVGARVRRWWWRVNNWKLPGNTSGRDDVQEFVEAQFGNAGAD